MKDFSSAPLRCPLYPPRPARGFTIQEMAVTLCISCSLVGGSAGMWNVLQQNAVIAAANGLAAHLALARTEAIAYNMRATICPTDDHKTCRDPAADFTFWQSGWMVYLDKNGNAEPEPDEIVRLEEGASGGLVIRSSRARRQVTYRPIGTAGGSTITFAVCSERNPALARYVIVSNTGRARVAQTTTSTVKCG